MLIAGCKQKAPQPHELGLFSVDLEEKEAVQRHGFVLDLGSARSAPRSTVYVRLLGPFSARSDLPSAALVRDKTRC